MNLLLLIGIAVGLSMDAFAVSVASGFVIKARKTAHAFRIALFFGGAQAVMPLLGWFLGGQVKEFIAWFDHWVAFVILSAIGVKMIYEATKLESERKPFDASNVNVLFLLAIATSIDAFAVGITLAVVGVPIWLPVAVIGIITVLLCLLGFLIGDRFGHMFESKLEILAGVVLILIGLKILLDHLLG